VDPDESYKKTCSIWPTHVPLRPGDAQPASAASGKSRASRQIIPYVLAKIPNDRVMLYVLAIQDSVPVVAKCGTSGEEPGVAHIFGRKILECKIARDIVHHKRPDPAISGSKKVSAGAVERNPV